MCWAVAVRAKRTLLQNLILSDLHNTKTRRHWFVVDGQGDLINKISHLALFDPDWRRARKPETRNHFP